MPFSVSIVKFSFLTYSLSGGRDILTFGFDEMSEVVLYRYTNVESYWFSIFSSALQSSPTGITAIGLLSITLYPLPLSL